MENKKLCEYCTHFSWEQAAKYFGHPCDVKTVLIDGCEHYEYIYSKDLKEKRND